MLEFGACPRCKMDISPERKRLHPVICDHCGHTVSNSEEKVDHQLQKKTMTVMGALATIWIAGYVQLANWDKHALSIIPIAIKSMVGAHDASDAEAKAGICMDLKKWDCVETEYLTVAQTNPNQFIRAGGFQMKRAKYNEAAQSYYKFFQSGGQDLEASYNYAKALAELGQVDEAVKYFDQVLAAKPDTLQITVVTNYVKLLMKHKRYDQAKILIEKVRKEAGPTGESFMNGELTEIKQITTAARE
jgi:tetratricopeptide (TPR) repeat protein